MFSKISLRSIILLLPFGCLAQTGPGGVGNASNNGLWLTAANVAAPNGTAFQTWPDASGNANDGGQTDPTMQPLFFNTSSMNGQPIVRLDGVDDLVVVPDAPLLDGSAGMTYLVVLRPNNLDGSTPRGILGKRVTYTTSTDYAYTWFFWGGDRLYNDINTQNNRYHTSQSFANATNYILGMDFDGSQPSASRSRLYNGGEVIRTAAESSSSVINSNQDLVLGALNKNYRAHLSADYAEVIQYNYSLNDAEHVIVHNYLSAKYNIPLANNLVYDEDNPANGNYDHDVAGIGYVDAANQHRRAQGSGILEVANPSALNSEKFFIWGDDRGALGFAPSANQPASVQSRSGRTWRASEVDLSGNAVDVGSLTLRWDLNGIPSIDAADLRLLVDTDNDGDFTDETPISGAVDVGNGLYQFNNIVSIANNSRFTLASAATILPVELGAFTAVAQGQHVALDWTTHTELNSAYFEVERSADAVEWTTIDRVSAAGDSRTTTPYSVLDEAPLQGWSYYRLKQVDLDGSFSHSVVRAVERHGFATPLRVYPNPTGDYLYVEGSDLGEAPIRVYNSSGTDVSPQVATQQESSNRLRLDLQQLPAGVYFVQTPYQVRRVQKT